MGQADAEEAGDQGLIGTRGGKSYNSSDGERLPHRNVAKLITVSEVEGSALYQSDRLVLDLVALLISGAVVNAGSGTGGDVFLNGAVTILRRA